VSSLRALTGTVNLNFAVQPAAPATNEGTVGIELPFNVLMRPLFPRGYFGYSVN